MLPTVLWAAALIGLILAGILSLERDDYRRAKNTMVAAQLRGLADGAIWSTVYDLENSIASRKLDGKPTVLDFEDHLVVIRVQDELGKIDVNLASEAMLRKILVTGGVDEQEADRLADCIQDWRERGAGKRLNGAKSDDYAAAGVAYGPRENPFLSTGEVRLVLGMSRALFDHVQSALTVYSENPNVTPTLSPPPVLLALRNGDADGAQNLIAERDAAATPSISLFGHAMTIESIAQSGDMKIVRRAVGRLTGQPGRSFDIYSWR